MNKHFLLILFLVLSHEIIDAQEILIIHEDFASQSFQKDNIFFLQDKTGKLSIHEITQEKYQKRFKVIPKNSPNFGYSTDAYWLKIKVKKNSNIPHVNYFLELAYPTLDTVQFYHQNKKGQWQ